MPSSRRSRRIDIVLLVVPVAIGALMASCGGDDGDGGPALTPEAVAGRDVARAAGCGGCHGQNGEGGVGPEWTGLAGSEVVLDDGATVVADSAYLARAISDPGAEVVDGFTVEMPVNELTDDEIAGIVAYIEELAP